MGKMLLSLTLTSSLLAASCNVFAALPDIELIRTDAPVATMAGTIVGGSITSDPIYDSDGDLLKGALEITFSLNASSANSYTVNGVSVAPGASETFVSDFSATGGRLNVPVSVDGAGSVSTDDYDLSVRVPGLIQWKLIKSAAFGQPYFLTAFFGPDDLIWVAVEDQTEGAGTGLGIIKLDIAGNIVDSFSLNTMVGQRGWSYEGATPDGNVILSSQFHSVIVAPNGQVFADYPYRIFEVLPDGTIYREAGDASTFGRMQLGRLFSSGDQAVANHPSNAWHNQRFEGAWGVVSKSDGFDHVNIDGVITRYRPDVPQLKSSFKRRYAAGSNGWVKLNGSTVFVNKDGRATFLRHTRSGSMEEGFTITSQGEWVTTFTTGSWLVAKNNLVKISSDGASAKTASFFCSDALVRSSFGKGAERNSQLLVTCGHSVQLVNLAAESKFEPWDKFVALEDLTPDSVSQGPVNANFGPPRSLPPSGVVHRTDSVYPVSVVKP